MGAIPFIATSLPIQSRKRSGHAAKRAWQRRNVWRSSSWQKKNIIRSAGWWRWRHIKTIPATAVCLVLSLRQTNAPIILSIRVSGCRSGVLLANHKPKRSSYCNCVSHWCTEEGAQEKKACPCYHSHMSIIARPPVGFVDGRLRIRFHKPLPAHINKWKSAYFAQSIITILAEI